MSHLFRWAGALALVLLPSLAFAQSLAPQCRNAGGQYVPCVPTVLVDKTATLIDSANPLPTTNVIQATATDRGASIGTTAVTLLAANTTRRGWSVQNQSTSASCYVNGSTTATADFHSLIVGPGGYFEPDHHVGTGAISIVCTAAATPVYAREW